MYIFPSRETFPALLHIFKYPCQTENTKSRNIRRIADQMRHTDETENNYYAMNM
jgi:hypothetical protein